jgi:hypothetical protein
MKKVILPVIAATLLLVSFGFIESDVCDDSMMFVKGTVSKTGYYKGDGTQTGTGTNTVMDVTTSGDSTIAMLETSYSDAKKPDEPRNSTMKFICVGGKIIMDMSGLLNSMGSAKGMTVEMTGNFVPYKTTYTAGEKLEDIHAVVKVFSNGQLFMTTNVEITNRVCEAVENKTVPAGTYHCFRISEMTTTSSEMRGMKMPGGGARKSVQWFSPKAGVVRMDSYDGDKISSYNELLSLTKPQ